MIFKAYPPRSLRQAAQGASVLAILTLAGLALAGCSDSVSSLSTSPFSQLIRGYDNTLTPAQQKQAIDQLQQEAKQADTEAKNAN